ncbi:MAG: glycoside hydrolase family 2 [Lachnospiraceae bacterium]|nr:glycoside hydrolase family 2 [Lachnospiraceae bacterium]
METLQLNKLLDKGDRKYYQLMTPWGEQIDKEQTSVVLTEYPRPQLARKNHMILNGIWKYAITSDDALPVIWDGDIRVPFSPETYLSGVQRQLKPEEYLWYERKLMIDRIPMEKRLLLNFGACDERCRVYVNDTLAGTHSGGYQAFAIDITDFIQVGKNTLRICVQDKSDTSYHGRGKQMLKNGGMFYSAQSGLWQTVWCEWVPETYIQELRITPEYDNDCVTIEIISNKYNDSHEGQNFDAIPCKILLFDQNQVTQEQKISVLPEEKTVIQINILDKKSWSPEHPFLYEIRIVYGEDMVESYFGMRLFTAEPDSNGVPRLCLNHLPYFQKGILDQGYYPESLLTPVSEEAMIFDIETAKAKGFNMIRKHCKIEPMRWYYHCDRLGMLVWQDMINGGTTYNLVKTCYIPTVLFPLRHKRDNDYSYTSRADRAGREEWKKECIETVRQLYNCVSICTWVLFNEGWGQFDAKENTDMVRAVDNTRIIDAHSGWFDQDAGDLKSEHIYFFELVTKKSKKPYVISEFGGISLAVPDHTYSDRYFGYGSQGDLKALKAAYDELDRRVQELKKEGLCASVYTQLTDIEEEINGIMTYDRRVLKL